MVRDLFRQTARLPSPLPILLGRGSANRQERLSTGNEQGGITHAKHLVLPHNCGLRCSLLVRSLVAPEDTGSTVTGAELKAWRQARGLSQADLGRKLHVKAQTVYRWEAGKRSISDMTALAITGLRERPISKP